MLTTAASQCSNYLKVFRAWESGVTWRTWAYNGDLGFRGRDRSQ